MITKSSGIAVLIAHAVMALSMHAAPVHEPTCNRALAAIREVAAEADIRVGYAHTGGGILNTTPATWSRQLRGAGLGSLALAARHAYGAAGNAAFVEAFTATALAVTSGRVAGTCYPATG